LIESNQFRQLKSLTNSQIIYLIQSDQLTSQNLHKFLESLCICKPEILQESEILIQEIQSHQKSVPEIKSSIENNLGKLKIILKKIVEVKTSFQNLIHIQTSYVYTIIDFLSTKELIVKEQYVKFELILGLIDSV
jgi:hypothetical protein